MPASRRTDFWFSIGLTALALAVTFESLRMPRLQELGVHPMSAPGVTPGLLGIVLAVLGLTLLFRSVRARRASEVAEALPVDPSASFRLPAALGVCLVYALGLVGHMPFMLATALFVFAFIGIFGFDRAWPVRSLVSAAVMAMVVAVAVSLLFEHVFLVRLP